MKLRVDALTSSPFYVALYFRQERVIDQIVANGQQAGVPHVNLGFLRKFPTLIPDSRVLRSFDAIVRVTYSGVLRKLRESATLSALRDALLPQLLSGSLRVPEAMRLVEKVI